MKILLFRGNFYLYIGENFFICVCKYRNRYVILCDWDIVYRLKLWVL